MDRRERLRPSVLRNEGIKHPFRRSLPIQFGRIAREEYDSDTATTARETGMGDDASLFLLSFLAFFTAFYTFIF
jgi:hypothetical protein